MEQAKGIIIMNENDVLNSSFRWRWSNSLAWTPADVSKLNDVLWINNNAVKARYNNKEVFIKRFTYHSSYIENYINIVDSLIDNGILTPRVRACPHVSNAIETDVLGDYTDLTTLKTPNLFISQLDILFKTASNNNWKEPPLQFSPWEYARDIHLALKFLSENISFGSKELNEFLIGIGDSLEDKFCHNKEVHHADMSPGNFVVQNNDKIIFLDITPAVYSSSNVYANAFYWLCLHPSGPWNSRENATLFIEQTLCFGKLNLKHIFRVIIEIWVLCYLISKGSKEWEHGWPAINGHIQALNNTLEWLEYFVFLKLVKVEEAAYFLSRGKTMSFLRYNQYELFMC